MSVLKKTLAFTCCVFLLGGCYEDESEIRLNADGSGTIKQKLVISERLIVATSEDGGDKSTPPVSKKEILEKVGSAVDIASLTLSEMPDGGRTIEFEGTFSSAEQFFLSEFCRDTLELRLAPVGDGKAVVYCDAQKSSDSGPSTTQLYGMAKGLYIKRTVHLPAEIEKTNGIRGQDGNTVSWITDLRNKDGLVRTKAFIEGKDKGVGSAVFDASAIKFSLPLKTINLSEEPAESEDTQTPQDSSELKAEIAWLTANKKILLDENDKKPIISDLELGVKVHWNENNKPFAYQTPVLTNIQDDLGNNLVRETHQNTHQIYSRTEKTIEIKTTPPSPNAKIVKNIEGYIPMVANIEKQKIVLNNIQELAEKENTGNPALDKLHFKIESIEGVRLKIQADGGNDSITSLEIFDKDGNEIKRSGSQGWGDNYTYNFETPIPNINKCEIEVITSETIVKIPFSLKEIILP